jgi:hypothetical protein
MISNLSRISQGSTLNRRKMMFDSNTNNFKDSLSIINSKKLIGGTVDMQSKKYLSAYIDSNILDKDQEMDPILKKMNKGEPCGRFLTNFNLRKKLPSLVNFHDN